jgi:hypothetical protein
MVIKGEEMTDKQKAPILTDEEIIVAINKTPDRCGLLLSMSEPFAREMRTLVQEVTDKCHEYYTKSDVPDDETLESKILTLLSTPPIMNRTKESAGEVNLKKLAADINSLIQPYYEQKIEQAKQDGYFKGYAHCGEVKGDIYAQFQKDLQQVKQDVKREFGERFFDGLTEPMGDDRGYAFDLYELNKRYQTLIKETGEDNGS